MGGTAQSKLAFISSTLKNKPEELNKLKTAVDNAQVRTFFFKFMIKRMVKFDLDTEILSMTCRLIRMAV